MERRLGWIHKARWPLPSDGIVREIYDRERIHVYTEGRSQHFQSLPQPHFLLPPCSAAMFSHCRLWYVSIDRSITNEILTKDEVKQFSPSRSEFRNLSFLITADDISGVWEQKGESICWQEEKKECTQGAVYLQFFFLNTRDRKCLS